MSDRAVLRKYAECDHRETAAVARVALGEGAPEDVAIARRAMAHRKRGVSVQAACMDAVEDWEALRLAAAH